MTKILVNTKMILKNYSNKIVIKSKNCKESFKIVSKKLLKKQTN